MKEPRLFKAESRILEQYRNLGTASVREILESFPEDERVAYTTVQTLVYKLEEKGALRKVKKIGNAHLFQPAIDQSQHRGRLVRDLLYLFGGSPRLLVSNLLENGALSLQSQEGLPSRTHSSFAYHGFVQCELVGYVILIDVTDVLDGFLSDAFAHNEFDISEP
jgi:BlaI family transcriptional regulator, penicillinase repressor